MYHKEDALKGKPWGAGEMSETWVSIADREQCDDGRMDMVTDMSRLVKFGMTCFPLELLLTKLWLFCLFGVLIKLLESCRLIQSVCFILQSNLAQWLVKCLAVRHYLKMRKWVTSYWSVNVFCFLSVRGSLGAKFGMIDCRLQKSKHLL